MIYHRFSGGLFDKLGKIVSAPFKTVANVSKNVASSVGSIGGSLIKGLGITSISTPVGTLTTAPEKIKTEKGSMISKPEITIQSTGVLDNLLKNKTILILGAVLILAVFFIMRKK